MKQHSVLEWKSLTYGEGDPAEEIKLADAERLLAVARRSPLGGKDGSAIIRLGHKGMTAGQVVGILAADGVELEILPKIDVPAQGAAARGQIREKLVHMLAVAFDLDIDGGTVTQLGWQRDHLLEIIIGLFSRKLAAAVRQGMPRLYVAQEEDLRALRGRLDVARQFSVHAANPSRLACRFDELSTDIALNQIMKAAIGRLRRVARSPENRRRLAELDFAYADVSSVPVLALRWDAVRIDRTNARWRDLLGLARFLLGDRFQTSSMGEQAGFSLLFEMNTLFEQYVGQLARRALRGSGLGVQLQGGGQYCLTSLPEGRKSFQTWPDMLIKAGDQVAMIVDTKWKRIAANTDDPKLGMSQADIYQMMAYGQIYGCLHLMLLYPHHADLPVAAPFWREHRIGQSGTRLTLGTVPIDSADATLAALYTLLGQVSALAVDRMSGVLSGSGPPRHFPNGGVDIMHAEAFAAMGD